MTGVIFDIKHFAIHDGPGIRQTIFFKGCPLSCWWCHNPESRSKEIVSFDKVEVFDGKRICETETIGKKYSVGELMKEIKKDLVFFEESGGGVTLSGGEPLLQFEFARELLKECKKHDIHTCIDTTGFTSENKIEAIAKNTDLFLYDLKLMDDNHHMNYTGVSNKVILNNLKLLDDIGKDIWIRFPLIPGINYDEVNLLKMKDFLSELKHTYPISILPYHKIGSHKYERFGMEYKMHKIDEPGIKQLENVKSYFINAGYIIKDE